jgi:hypothetical protein
MSIEEAMVLPKGCIIIDSWSGEELKYNGTDNSYVMGLDNRGTTVWLLPERIIFHE